MSAVIGVNIFDINIANLTKLAFVVISIFGVSFGPFIYVVRIVISWILFFLFCQDSKIFLISYSSTNDWFMVVITCKYFYVNSTNAQVSWFVRTVQISDLTKGKIFFYLKDHVLANLYLVGLWDNLSSRWVFQRNSFVDLKIYINSR